MGPTGVGKTELVKCLAGEMFDSVDSLIRLDMSEFMEKAHGLQDHWLPRAMWAMTRRVQLTEKIRRRPYAWFCLTRLKRPIPMC